MPFDDVRIGGGVIIPPSADGDGGGIYCRRCDEVDCEWFGTCPHTPDIWITMNPTSEMARYRRARKRST